MRVTMSASKTLWMYVLYVLLDKLFIMTKVKFNNFSLCLCCTNVLYGPLQNVLLKTTEISKWSTLIFPYVLA